MLCAAPDDFVEAPRRLIEADACVARTFGDLLDPHEDRGPHGLRARVAAPDATDDGRHGEQRERRDDQQPREQHEILRPEREAEDVEVPRRQIEQHRLAAAPVEPRQTEVADQQRPAGIQPNALEAPVDCAREDLLAALVQVDRRETGDGVARISVLRASRRRTAGAVACGCAARRTTYAATDSDIGATIAMRSSPSDRRKARHRAGAAVPDRERDRVGSAPYSHTSFVRSGAPKRVMPLPVRTVARDAERLELRRARARRPPRRAVRARTGSTRIAPCR